MSEQHLQITAPPPVPQGDLAQMGARIREMDTVMHQLWDALQDGQPLDDLVQEGSLVISCIGSVWFKRLLPLLERNTE